MIPKKLKEISTELRLSDWLKPILRLTDVYIVGGTIRDVFLGKSIKDIDLIVDKLSLEKIKNLLLPHGRVDIVGESFSVIKFKPKGFRGEPYDIAIPRMDRKIGKGHKGFEIITDNVDILTDLKRRDFTINSIAVNIRNNELIDPFYGIDDINDKLLRATNKTSFFEDPLRILRGIQFAARFNFSIESNTLKLMKQNSKFIKEISGERIFEELMKILNKKGNTSLALNLLNKTGVDKALFDKEMLTYGVDDFEKLDPISFFYVLGLLGDVNPGDFLKKRLKGDSKLEDNVRTLDNIITLLPKVSKNEEDFKFMLFKAFNKSPKVIDANILPTETREIVYNMKVNKIPMTEDDIKITGEDIMKIGNLKEGPEIGFIKEKILRDALMNRFNWKDRNDSLEYLANLLLL